MPFCYFWATLYRPIYINLWGSITVLYWIWKGEGGGDRGRIKLGLDVSKERLNNHCAGFNGRSSIHNFAPWMSGDTPVFCYATWIGNWHLYATMLSHSVMLLGVAIVAIEAFIHWTVTVTTLHLYLHSYIVVEILQCMATRYMDYI